MDWDQLARQLITALRGKRSQKRLSERLGYASNVIYRWETGRSYPAAEDFFRLVGLTGSPVLARLKQFRPDWALDVKLGEREGAMQLLELLREGMPMTELVQKTGRSRFIIRRWLDGTTAIRLPELLHWIEVCSLRLLDFVACLIAPNKLPCISTSYRSLQASRKAAYEMPWSHAVLRALELSDYAALKCHRKGWIAQRIGISLQIEEECLQVLSDAEQIAWDGKHYAVQEVRTVVTQQARDRTRATKAFWFDVNRERQRSGAPGTYGYNLCTVSRADHERIEELYRRFFHEMQQIVAGSTPGEEVVLVTGQIVALRSTTR